MAFRINHIHLKAPDPRKTADWYVKAFNFKILSDETRVFGDRFVRCMSEDGGIAVNISGARTGEKLGTGDAMPHHGLEHFGFDSANLDADIARLGALGCPLARGADPGAERAAHRLRPRTRRRAHRADRAAEEARRLRRLLLASGARSLSIARQSHAARAGRDGLPGPSVYPAEAGAPPGDLEGDRRQELRARAMRNRAHSATATSAAPLRPSAGATPSQETSAPIWNWPTGPTPIATTQAPLARPRSAAGTACCMRLCPEDVRHRADRVDQEEQEEDGAVAGSEAQRGHARAERPEHGDEDGREARPAGSGGRR